MKVLFTQNQSIFNQLNVPTFRYCHQWFKHSYHFPFSLEFNRTYYKYIGNKLSAFRILAYTIDDENSDKGNLIFLVQLPNQKPQWINNFINRNTDVYASVDDYVLSGGTNTISLCWCPIHKNLPMVEIFRDGRSFFTETFYTIKNGAVCNSSGHYCNRLVVTSEGCLVGISTRNSSSHKGEEGVYMTKSDAMKVLLNGMEIVDFVDDPIKIEIDVLPSTPKYMKLMFVE